MVHWVVTVTIRMCSLSTFDPECVQEGTRSVGTSTVGFHLCWVHRQSPGFLCVSDYVGASSRYLLPFTTGLAVGSTWSLCKTFHFPRSVLPLAHQGTCTLSSHPSRRLCLSSTRPWSSTPSSPILVDGLPTPLGKTLHHQRVVVLHGLRWLNK